MTLRFQQEMTMKSIFAACCATVLAVAGVSAQSGTMPKGHDGMDMPGATMKMSGCVSQGADGHFMLTNAMKSGETKSGMKAMTYDLMGGELKNHVGHRVEVTGKLDGKMADAGMMGKDKTNASAMPEKSSADAGELGKDKSDATRATTGSGSTDAGKMGKDKTDSTMANDRMSSDGHDHITVQSVKMISANCS